MHHILFAQYRPHSLFKITSQYRYPLAPHPFFPPLLLFTISTENSATLRQEFAVGTYKKTIPGPDVYVHTLNYTTDELDELAESMSTIRTYVNEQRTKYILGDTSDLSDPAKFIENLKTSFQLDRILEVANIAYERQYK